MLILLIKRYKPLIPGALVALILGTVIAGAFQLSANYGVAVVGDIPIGMPSPTLPIISLQAIPFLIGGAFGIVFLAVGETLGTGRTFAAKYHYEVNADQELLAMGAANIGSGLFQGITIDMSLSNTASGEAAGERTQLSSLVSAGVILAVVVFLAPLLRNLEQLTGKLFIEAITPGWFIFSDGFKLTPLNILLKNILDKAFALCLSVIALPLFPIIATLIKLESRGPVFYRQARVGQGDRPLLVYKFRSMRQDAESGSGAVWAKKDDVRVTRIGRILRKTRLDELPQLINVLKGDMSFIGPRPERPAVR